MSQQIGQMNIQNWSKMVMNGEEWNRIVKKGKTHRVADPTGEHGYGRQQLFHVTC
jgi:hypothetical protein